MRQGSVGGQLDHVRPPVPPCLPDQPDPTSGLLMDRAAAEYEHERYDRALACSDEAVEIEPRLVPALHYRAASLAALGRLDEARLAFSRALAVDPDDPETLWSASDFYVSKLGADRDALEVGLEYAERGARVAVKRPRRDRDLASRLLVLAAMAENDLGRSRPALAHADQALAARTDDVDALYERGVALYELCRFADSERAFAKMLQKAPDDGWAVHYLGLLEERKGDQAKAQSLLRRAAGLEPSEFKAELAVDRQTFQVELDQAVGSLDAIDKRALQTVPVEVEDLPSLADLTAVDPPLSPSILGLYRGPSEKESCETSDGPKCRSIVLYRKNLIRFARDAQELSEQVKVTLLHELGHYHGESDERLRARGLE
jgi:tetratricopeptide (TPR) repeat protein